MPMLYLLNLLDPQMSNCLFFRAALVQCRWLIFLCRYFSFQRQAIISVFLPNGQHMFSGLQFSLDFI